MRRSERKIFRLFLLISLFFLVFLLPDPTPAADPLANWYWRNPLPQGNYLRDAVYANGIFVVVGDGGAILTSADGTAWIPRSSGTTSKLWGIAYGNGLFAAVGWDGTILTSADGVAWTSRTSGTTEQLRDVAYGNGTFVAVGGLPYNSSVILTSTDGVAWTPRNSGTTGGFNGVTFGNGLFVAVGNSGALVTSANGSTWTPRTWEVSGQLYGVAYGGGVYVAVGGDTDFGGFSTVVTSPDGTTWTRGGAGTSNMMSGVGYWNGLFVAVGVKGTILTSSNGAAWTSQVSGTNKWLFVIAFGNGAFVTAGQDGAIFTSIDGAAWTSKTSGATQNLEGIAYGNGTYVAAGYNGTILTSPNGTAWVSQNSGTTAWLRGVAYGNGTYATAGYNGTILTSPDGVTWTSRTSGTTNHLYDIAYGNGNFVAVGKGGTILTSPDGTAWTPRPGATYPLDGIAYGNGSFVAVGSAGTIFTSPDGATWTSQISGTPYNALDGVAYGNGLYVVVGEYGTILTSPNGTAWTPRTSGTEENLHKVAYGNGAFAVVVNDGTILTSLNGTAWTARTSGTNNQLFGITYGNGAFMAAGGGGTILQSGAMNTHAITATADANGTISPSGLVRITDGETVAFTITPNAGSRIADVLVDGVSQGAVTTYTFANITVDHTVSAKFTGVRQLIGLTVTGSSTMQAGGSQTLTLTGRYSDSSTDTVANADASWISLDTQIAVVNSGSVEAIAQGKTTITASHKGVVGSIAITVGAPPAAQQHHGNLILVAGGGVMATNTIREATLYLADLVYSRFKGRLFSDEEIYYYRPIPWADLDGDGKDDHIVDVSLEREEFNVADFGQKITQWAANQNSDGPLYIYLIDHGGPGNFLLYPNQILTAAQLNNYLNVFQERTGRRVVIMIEACKSGTFATELVRDGQNRIIVTSADDKDSYMQLGGRISFTQYFIDRLFEGNSLLQGYLKAKDRLANQGRPYSDMKPQMREGTPLAANTVYLGGDFGVAGLYPEIVDRTPNRRVAAGIPQTLFARLSSLERIESVWAIITPPDYVPPTTSENLEAPEVNLPTIRLNNPAGDEQFSGSYQNFTLPGDYRILFYARNGTGNVSVSPVTIITVTAPGEINGDTQINLADAILALQIAAGLNLSTPNLAADVNLDGKIGLPEAIYILQKVAGMR